MRSYNVTAGQINYSSWSTKYLTNEHNNNWKERSAKLMHGTIHSYYDMGVAMVDCVIVITYILHFWGPLELQLFYSILGCQEKATETICS